MSTAKPIMKLVKDTRGVAVAIAKACHVTRSAVYQWKRVPPEYVQRVARITGLSHEEIRPDLFKRNGKR